MVLNFFTHDCVPCIREHPELIEFVDQQRALGVDGAEFYSIVRDSTRDEIDSFFSERGGDWPIVFDDRYEFVNGFGVALVPETWIIDPNGFVRRRFIGTVTAIGLSGTIQTMREWPPSAERNFLLVMKFRPMPMKPGDWSPPPTEPARVENFMPAGVMPWWPR